MNIAQLIQANWPIFAVVVVLAILAVVWLIGRSTRSKVRERRPDVLDEGAAPAQRNQALIDAAPAAAVVPPPILATTPPANFARVVKPAPVPAPVSASAPVSVAPVAPLTPATAPEKAVEAAAKPKSQDMAPVVVEPAQETVVETVQEVVAQPELEVAPEPVVVPAPEVIPEPAAATPVASAPDDLRRIKGLGPKLVATLQALGVTQFAQIAAWTDADLDELDTQLGAFAGRPRRDNWIEQARLLSGGDTSAYEAKFGKL